MRDADLVFPAVQLSDAALARALEEAASRIAADESVRVVLLRGAGSRFCAGGDVRAFADAGDDLADALEAVLAALHPAVDTTTVELTLSQPDQWLVGELSATPGMVVEKAFAEKAGKDFGTVQGLTMCSGPFTLESWKTGQGITVVPNPTYWDSSLPKPKFTKMTLVGVADDAALTAGLETGAISGTYLADRKSVV